MEPRSSISSSELTPTPAFWIGAATTLALGLLASLVAGYGGASPADAGFPNLRREAYRYRLSDDPRSSQVLLLGTSRMRHGVVEEELEPLLGPGWRAINLGLDSAGLGEVARLASLLEKPKAAGRRVAVLEVHPAEFDRGACRLAAPLPAWRAAWPARRELSVWLPELVYGGLGGLFPGLVPAPAPLPRLLWTVDAEARRRAVARMTPQALAASAKSWSFDGTCAETLSETIQTLKEKGFRVVLLETPSAAAWSSALPSLSAYRGALQDSGADAVLSVPDARSLGAGEDVFYDYSHLSPEGARLLTAELASFLKKPR